MIYSPYWIINKTNMPLTLRDKKSITRTQITAAPIFDDVCHPVLFTTTKSSACVGINAKQWSRSFNIDTLGIKVAFDMTMAAQISATANKLRV